MAVFDGRDGDNYELLTPPNYFTYVMAIGFRAV